MLRFAIITLLTLKAVFAAESSPLSPFARTEVTTNRDFRIQFSSAFSFATLERSTDFSAWEPLVTVQRSASSEHVDTGAPFHAQSFYRAAIHETNVLTGDHLATEQGSLLIHPINHASFVLSWNGLTIYNDPVRGAAPYAGLPRADLILVSHEHGDHFDSGTLNAVRRTDATNTIIIAPRNVYNGLSTALKALTIILTNGAGTNLLGLSVEAVPAYNGNHPKGTGNGYLLSAGSKRLYISGDTGDIPETRALKHIDVAFLCMNVPFTMTVPQAANVVREFAPRVVYPYHYRNSDSTLADLNLFRRLAGSDKNIEVRQRAWY
ncbi:MAG TPA: MBL fold metallo-hydrolase [Candidatus Acidoferrum sp.]|nr:MBL fold metallo-hydrolase [Candidatus Acidoferrum sp.]